LDVSRIEIGKLPIAYITFNDMYMITELISIMQPLAKIRNNKLIFNYKQSDTSWLRGDPTLIKRILMNFLSNSIKFTKDGIITVTLEHLSLNENETQVTAIVEDTGCGMTETQQKRLFTEQFHKEKPTREGLGIGLWLCNQIVTLLGGKIGMSSVLGEGSRFWFTVTLGKVIAPEEKAGKVGTFPLSLKKRILLAEDNILNQQILAKFLRDLGCEYTIAENGLLVVEYAIKEKYDAILMDIQMPVKDGIEATKEIRASGVTIPICGLTATIGETLKQLCLDVGMDQFLTKPVQKVQLGNTLQELFKRPYHA